MILKVFFLTIILVSLFLTTYKPDTKLKKIKNLNVASVIFDDSVLYDININNISRIIQSQKAYNYDNKKELYDTTILVRNGVNTNSISAEYMVKQNNIFKLYQNVFISRNNDTQINSDYMQYNEKKQIIQNNTDFILNYDKNQLIGDNLYYDMKQGIFTAKNTHFKIVRDE